MKAIPTVRQYMTSAPHTVGPMARLVDAHQLMTERRIRHLPVCEGERVVGVVSEGDLYRAESVRGASAERIQIKDVMIRKPYMVSADAPLDEVVEAMAGQKVGSAIVMDGGALVGVFTATDAMGALAELLETRLRK